jgi:hypothetical protein
MSISETTYDFLRVLCGENPLYLYILKVFIRNVLTAPFEGRNWESGMYLYGAPGISKSVWVELLKLLVPSVFLY